MVCSYRISLISSSAKTEMTMEKQAFEDVSPIENSVGSLFPC